MPAKQYRDNGDPQLKSHARRLLRAAVRRHAIATGRGCEIPHCVMTSRTIHWAARWPDPWSYALDEITPRAHGGSPTDPTNVRPAHVRCNSVAGAAITNNKTTTRELTLVHTVEAYSNPDF